MSPFAYARAASVSDTVRQGAAAGAKFLGGGTNLVDLMRETVERPCTLIDVSRLDAAISELDGGGLRIDGAARNTASAEHRGVRERYPVLARAILAGASAQIRNVATLGGNLLQRTRCTCFFDAEGSRRNKHSPGQGRDAIAGFNRSHAILGASPACVATHPSDMAVALAALDAVVRINGAHGERTRSINDLHRLPDDRPDVETELARGEPITAVDLAALPLYGRSTYRKVRDRSSYAFALVSVAAALEVNEGGVADVRIALGGVAHKPWRAWKAEAALRGAPVTTDAFRAAIDAELADARPLQHNASKIELARRSVVAVLEELAGAAACATSSTPPWRRRRARRCWAGRATSWWCTTAPRACSTWPGRWRKCSA
jgi:xanthine dehydrogenase YagS FAD-binding subunit